MHIIFKLHKLNHIINLISKYNIVIFVTLVVFNESPWGVSGFELCCIPVANQLSVQVARPKEVMSVVTSSSSRKQNDK